MTASEPPKQSDGQNKPNDTPPANPPKDAATNATDSDQVTKKWYHNFLGGCYSDRAANPKK